MARDRYEGLVGVLGPTRVVRDEDALERFAQDESGLGRYPADAAARGGTVAAARGEQ